ncbi:MAG TPA: long-chain fatty acid--CoA ligase, partial [Polyangiales bacterium]
CDVYDTSVRRFAARPLFGVREPRGYRWLTYRDFGGRVDMLRAALLSRGLARGDRVALIAPNSPEWAQVAFATFTAGGVLVPIYPYQRYDDWLDILRDAAPRFVFAYGIEAASAVNGWRKDLPEELSLVCMHDRGIFGAMSLDEFLGRAFEHAQPVVQPEPEDLCQLIYTSGTMGRAKGVQLTHRNVASNLSALHQIFPVVADDRSLSFLPWAHAFGQVVELYGLFSVGASLALSPSEDEVVKSMQEVQPTLLFSVPRLFNRLHEVVLDRVRSEGGVARRLFDASMQNARERRRVRAQGKARARVELKAKLFDRLVFERIRARLGGRVRYAVSGGAPLSPEVAEFVDSIGITLYEGYGLTECSPIVSANWPGARRLGSVGKPLPRVRVHIDHSAGSNSRDGEIVVHGPNVMRGYYNLPEETAHVMTEDGGLRTGDLGYIDREGFLFVTGRIKEQYRLDNGRYVVPSPLEQELCRSELIEQAVLCGDGHAYNVALVVPNMHALRRWADREHVYAPDSASLIEHAEVRAQFAREIERCSESFREYEKVRNFALLPSPLSLEAGTLTPSLKVRRRVVAERYHELIEGLYGRKLGENVPRV